MKSAIAALLIAVTALWDDAEALDARTLVRDAADLVEAQFVHADRANLAAMDLRNAAEAGEFDSLSGEALARAMTRHLETATGDSHIGVVFDPERVARYRDREQAASSADAEARRRERRQASIAASQNNGFGITAVQRLPGQIGYLRIDEFDGNILTDGQVVLDGSFAGLRGSRAVIIDLRRCIGGQLEAMQMFVNHFIGPDPTSVMRQSERWQNRTETFFTSPVAPEQAFHTQPVIILTSGMTFSAAEIFAYHLRHSRTGVTIVGEPSFGGGVGWDPVVLSDEFYIRMPRLLLVNTTTGTMFTEGEGVLPDLPVDNANALSAGYREALRQTRSQRASAAEADWLERLAVADAGDGAGDRPERFEGVYGPYDFRARNRYLELSFAGHRPFRLRALSDGVYFNDRSRQQQFIFTPADAGEYALRVETLDNYDGLSVDVFGH